MRYALRRLAEALHGYARAQGWGREDYRIFVHPKPEWARIHVAFVARRFPGRKAEDQWLSVLDHLDKALADVPELADSINLTVRTFEEVEGGGIYGLGPNFVDVDELLAVHSPA